ncbi:type II secretion system protein [Candidatus Saccharibacteria bacterium]|nr:type II secretion system protein [Candidatus Saccharibacteria bacterium]
MKKRGGFTLIELSLSLVFIAILSLTVVLLIQNTMASYRRGVILNQVNTVGMDLIDDMRSSVQYATSDPVTRMCEMYYEKKDESTSDYQKCIGDSAYSFISVTKEATVDGVGGNVPVYGAFCTGTYTYLWVSGYFDQGKIDETGVARPKVYTKNPTPGLSVSLGFGDDSGWIEESAGAESDGDTILAENFRLLKVYDDERSVCVNAMENQKDTGSSKYIKRESYDNKKINSNFLLSENANEEKGIDLLDQKDANDLVLYDFYVSPPAESATRRNIFYAASFILGTKRGGINITQVGNNCKPPSEYDSELDYCAINKFNFAVQAGGE